VGVVWLLSGCDVKVGQGGVSFDIAHGRASEEWVRTYELGRGAELEVLNINGEIEVQAADGAQVEVRAYREVRASSDEAAKELLAKFEIAEEVSPSRVKIQSRSTAGSLGIFDRGRGHVRYTVKVPPGLRTQFRTENGGVRLQNVQGMIRAETTNGGIVGRGVSGSVTASTVNGGVQLAMRAVSGEIQVSSVNGGVRLELPSDVNAELEASAVNGGVTVDSALRFEASENDRRRVSGRLNRGGQRITAHTTNGGVRVSALGLVPADARANR
jgi:hypothetical protein